VNSLVWITNQRSGDGSHLQRFQRRKFLTGSLKDKFIRHSTTYNLPNLILTRYCTAELALSHLNTYLIRLSTFWTGVSPPRLVFSAADPLTRCLEAFLGIRVDVVHWTGILETHKHFVVCGVCGFR